MNDKNPAFDDGPVIHIVPDEAGNMIFFACRNNQIVGYWGNNREAMMLGLLELRWPAEELDFSIDDENNYMGIEEREFLIMNLVVEHAFNLEDIEQFEFTKLSKLSSPSARDTSAEH